MTKFIYFIAILLCATLWLFALSRMAPNVSEEPIRFPKSFDDLSRLANLLKAYSEHNKLFLFILFISAYLYKQTFCIPGSAFLNLLGGAVFNWWLALPLCCLLTSIGATFSYMMSKAFAEDLVVSYWPKEVKSLKKKIESNNHNLFTYLLSLRLLPFTPNWLLNLISPLVGVPLHLFFASVFIGLIPYNFICVQSGAMLHSFSSLNDVFTSSSFLQLTLLAITAFIVPKIVERCVSVK